MSKPNIYPVKPDFAATAHLNSDQYHAMYQASVSQPEMFWNVQAKNYLTWDQQWTNVCEYDFKQGQASWFNGGKLNVTTNCIDRHLADRANQTAIIWEGDEPDQQKLISYAELHEAVCRLAKA